MPEIIYKPGQEYRQEACTVDAIASTCTAMSVDGWELATVLDAVAAIDAARHKTHTLLFRRIAFLGRAE